MTTMRAPGWIRYTCEDGCLDVWAPRADSTARSWELTLEHGGVHQTVVSRWIIDVLCGRAK